MQQRRPPTKEKTMKLSTWNKPNSNEVRVYFNGVSREVKVFAVEAADDRFEIKFSTHLYPSQQDSILDTIDRELEELNNGERVIRWSDLKNLAK